MRAQRLSAVVKVVTETMSEAIETSGTSQCTNDMCGCKEAEYQY